GPRGGVLGGHVHHARGPGGVQVAQLTHTQILEVCTAAALRTHSATTGATAASNTLGTMNEALSRSSSTTSAIASAAASSMSSVTVRACASSNPRNTPGKASTLLIWFG